MSEENIEKEEVKEEKSLVLEAHEIVNIPEGRHEGEIVDVKYRQWKDYEYVDFYFKPSDVETDVGIKWGAPAYISSNSKLGRFLSVLSDWNPGDSVDLKSFIGCKVSFVTAQEQTDRGVFSKIVDGSFWKTGSLSIGEVHL